MSTESSIANHPHRTSLATVVRTLALTAADERRSRLGDGLEELVKEHRLGDANGRVGDVDVLAVLRTLDAGKGPSPKESAMLSRLLAYGVADRVGFYLPYHHDDELIGEVMDHVAKRR